MDEILLSPLDRYSSWEFDILPSSFWQDPKSGNRVYSIVRRPMLAEARQTCL